MKKFFNFAFTISVLFFLNGCIQAALTAVTGVGYSVAQERSVGNAVDDAGILGQIESEYVQKDVNNLFHKIDVQVHEGRVLLTGSVLEPEHRVEAVRLAWQPQGVKEVINEIQVVDKEGTPKDYAIDAWVTTQIKAKLLVSGEIKSINYSVETVNAIVYLMGVAQNQTELDKVTNIASTIKGVKKVISHVRLKDNVLR